MATDRLLTIADELYALTPEEFTKARNDIAKEAKAEDRALAESVKRLPKPSTAAWLVNMLARHRSVELDQILSLGAALRQAQENLDGAGLRELNKQRRQLTAAVTTQARGLGHQLGVRISETVAGQVEETLRAAMTDEGAARAVRTGQLVEALSATGVGELDVSTAVAVPAAIGLSAPAVERQRPTLTVVADPQDSAASVEGEPGLEMEQAAQQAAQRAAEAAEAAAGAQKKLAKAQRRVAKLEARSLQLQGELEEVRRRAGEIEYDLEAVDDALSSAEERRERAQADHAKAEAALANLER